MGEKKRKGDERRQRGKRRPKDGDEKILVDKGADEKSAPEMKREGDGFWFLGGGEGHKKKCTVRSSKQDEQTQQNHNGGEGGKGEKEKDAKTACSKRKEEREKQQRPKKSQPQKTARTNGGR